MGHKGMIEVFDPLKEDILQIIDEHGAVVQPRYEPALQENELKKIYSLMQMTRAADIKAIKLTGLFHGLTPGLLNFVVLFQ